VGRGFYFPSQPNFQVGLGTGDTGFRLQELGFVAAQSRQWLRVDFGLVTESKMKSIASQMENPVLAPLQITENDDDELIVYDPATQTTAYSIRRSNERMNSTGYLSGSGQPCLVFLRCNGQEMTVSAVKTNPAGNVRLKLFGDWKLVDDEKRVIRCVPKAGRTWIEWTTSAETIETIHLDKLPDKSYFQRLYEAIVKSNK
jgi:hypothetical protein